MIATSTKVERASAVARSTMQVQVESPLTGAWLDVGSLKSRCEVCRFRERSLTTLPLRALDVELGVVVALSSERENALTRATSLRRRPVASSGCAGDRTR